MTICCSGGQFKLCSLYTTGALQSSIIGSRLPSACFPPATRWGKRRVACPVAPASGTRIPRAWVVRASAVDSYESSSEFVRRIEQAWLISQVNPKKKQARPEGKHMN
ncbi:hypothetical protein Taro_012310 [Colocasia esculenta]|uniref:Uncharacterized protein n=1 Tax=Colocasia esculenta TaxID=4460 RepID=A0A843U3M7_COLES|nr:hypothetical protein [Colocasia esculenta]